VTNKVYAGGSGELIYRPVTLTVVDAETGRPLEGITVFAVNVIGYERFFIADNISRHVAHFYEYRTDENGVVEIPQFRYRANRHHFVHTQRIGINIQLRNKNTRRRVQRDTFATWSFSDNSRFFRPQAEFKAGHVMYHTFPRSGEVPEIMRRYSTTIFKRYAIIGFMAEQRNFPSDHEEITFFLERFNE